VFISPNDWIVPATAGRALAKQLPRAKLLAPIPAGHSAMIDPRVDVAGWLKDDRLWV
jgi:pimeloyl-ACP methyl ester carboxylesterase